MNKYFTNIDRKNSAVEVHQIGYQPDRLDKLIKQNQKTIVIIGTFKKLLVKK